MSAKAVSAVRVQAALPFCRAGLELLVPPPFALHGSQSRGTPNSNRPVCLVRRIVTWVAGVLSGAPRDRFTCVARIRHNTGRLFNQHKTNHVRSWRAPAVAILCRPPSGEPAGRG